MKSTMSRKKPEHRTGGEHAQFLHLFRPGLTDEIPFPAAVSQEKYAGKPPKIYYDPRYRVYISPTNLDEDGEIIWVCSELVQDCLIYEYRLGEQETHAHSFDQVLRDAYDYAETFSIPEAYREQYSAQELKFLENLIRRGCKDREKDSTEEGEK